MKIIGLGNALIDILTMVDDEQLLEALGLPKGSMQLVDATKSTEVQERTHHLRKQKASGGSASNTIHGLARLGLETAFIGHVGQDETGDFFEEDMRAAGIKPFLFRSDSPSGIANALITSDGERTFATYLGAAIELSDTHMSPELFKGYDVLYVEGYMVQNEPMLVQAMKLAKQEGLKIALDLASYNVVEDNLELLKRLLTDYVDIVFANAEEAKAFTGKEAEEALNILSEYCEYAIVKLGAQGSLIKFGDEVAKIGVIDVKPIDTTGAGDLFAAGFLYGYAKNWSLENAGKLGALLSGRVIEIIGPKMDNQLWETIFTEIDDIKP